MFPYTYVEMFAEIFAKTCPRVRSILWNGTDRNEKERRAIIFTERTTDDRRIVINIY